MLSRFHMIPERHRRNGRTDGLTDRRTDIIAISISRVSMLTRNKKRISLREKKLGSLLFDFGVVNCDVLRLDVEYC